MKLRAEKSHKLGCEQVNAVDGYQKPDNFLLRMALSAAADVR